MASVIGSSPVTFISEDTSPGVQFQAPLSALTITNGAVNSSNWKPKTALGANDAKILAALLQDLLARGVISAGA